jgi:hypothetical protein
LHRGISFVMLIRRSHRPALGDHQVPIIFFCQHCGREIRVRSICVGRKGRCVDCGAEIVVPDIDPFNTRPRPANDPAGDDKPKTQIVESSSEIPTVNHGFMDDGEAPQQTTRR